MFLYTSPFWVAVLLPLLVHTERLRALQWVGLACAFAAVVFALREGFLRRRRGPDLARRPARAGGRRVLGPDHGDHPRHRAGPGVAREDAVLPGGGEHDRAAFPVGGRWASAGAFDFSAFAAVSLVVQTVVGAFASYLAWMWMLGRYPATKISVFVFLTPLFALLFGALWLHEAVTPSLLAALALVAAGIVLVNRKPG